MRAAIALLIATGAFGLLVTEAAMRPSGSDRVTLYAVFGSVTVAAAVAAWWLARRTRRFRSLTTTVQLVGLAAVLVAGSAVAAASLTMFINVHDLRLVLVALALGVALGVVLAVAVTGQITRDLDRLSHTAHAVVAGDYTMRTGIDRLDEVGQTARDVDEMVARLAELDAERRNEERVRREYLAAISHDLRTPLAAMQAALEAIEDGVADDPPRYLKSMSTDLDALTELVDDLAVLAAVEAGGVAVDGVVDLSELVDEALEALAPVAAIRGIELESDSTGDTRVVGDAAALGRVIRNLVDNALRYAGSKVSLAVGSADGEVTVEVGDDGPGFPAGFSAHAFDRFRTADPSRTRGSGSGLGLAIARSVVEAHEGRIWIEQAVGRGARIRFAVPASGSPTLGADV